MQDTVQRITKDFFNNLSIPYNLENVKQEPGPGFYIKITTPEAGILIGNNGRTLTEIQTILRLLISTSLKQRVRVHLEINNYLQEKDNKLIEYIDKKIGEIQNTRQNIELPFFSSYERKKIHNYVSSLENNICTQSTGEGTERRITLCKKEEKLTIDIESTGI